MLLYVTDKPSAPPNLRVTEIYKDYSVLAWDVPTNDGGSPIKAYNVEKRDTKRAAFTKAGETNAKTLTMKVPKLVEGNEYIFQVAAENEIGESDFTTLDPVKARLPFGEYINH